MSRVYFYYWNINMIKIVVVKEFIFFIKNCEMFFIILRLYDLFGVFGGWILVLLFSCSCELWFVVEICKCIVNKIGNKFRVVFVGK